MINEVQACLQDTLTIVNMWKIEWYHLKKLQNNPELLDFVLLILMIAPLLGD